MATFASDPVYPVKNIRYISEFDYPSEVQYSDKYVVMVFSNDSCLERVMIDRTCWLFEKKLDFFIPGFSSKIKVVGFNTFFDNYLMVRDFSIRKTPTVIIMIGGKILERFEPDFSVRRVNRIPQLPWEDQLLKDVLTVIQQIR